MARLIPPPDVGEYRDYAAAYISLVPAGGRLLECLRDGADVTESMLRAYPSDGLTTPHAPGEWTIQDVLQHVTDQERVFGYRILAFARGERAPLPGFDQEAYAAAARANERNLDEVLGEYRAVRDSTIRLVRGLTEDVLRNAGTSDGHALSVRAAIYIVAGHELYHLDSLRQNYGDYR